MYIAITASKSKTQYYINSVYIDYILKAGYFPYIICTEDEIHQALKICDGLILPGGTDLNPIYYGYSNIQSFAVNQEKDAFERAAFHSFRYVNKPIFGICRGFQLIIMEFLYEFPKYRKILNFEFHIGNHSQANITDTPRNTPTHFVEYVSKHLYGKNGLNIENLGVNSMHHQCLIEKFSLEQRDKNSGVKIKVNYKDFTKIAWTRHGMKNDEKGTIVEAFTIDNWGPKIIAVQWHPEELNDYRLLHNIFEKTSMIKNNKEMK
ncbi:MAG: gamma-glutamyl-gamma-aminobutyrate hydrolase family protein [Patescibacteria group bacterium]|nr:gamma-glutamyl-gamma-aminobutyrate hydrolase family protein [Patescibacteria group bacterium]